MDASKQIGPLSELSRIRLAAALVNDLLDQARDRAGEEICGVLVGNRSEQQVLAFHPGQNLAADPSRHFLLDPATLLSADRAARVHGCEIIGFYHSHPAQLPVPSAADCATMWPQAVQIIVGSHQGRTLLCAWQHRAGRLHPCAVQIER